MSFRLCSVLLSVLVLIPFGLRWATWPSTRAREYDAVVANKGRELFVHEWRPGDPLANQGDGLGPVFNATSCVACHSQPSPGGAGGLLHNVTTFTVRPVSLQRKPLEGVVHVQATRPEFQESLTHVHSSLPRLSQPPLSDLLPIPGCNVRRLPFPRGIHISQRNTPALFGTKLVDAIPGERILANERRQRLAAGLATSEVEYSTVGRAVILADGRVGRFGWKGQTASLSDFVQAACANELGLGNPGSPQARPLTKPDYKPSGLDLTAEQCEQLTSFVAALPRPWEEFPTSVEARGHATAGRKLFHKIGCADCHVPDVGDVKGLYSDLLLHRMGAALEGGGAYDEPPLETPQFDAGSGPHPSEWRTPPLWGVADSAPYMHDGRAATLQEAIALHGGQGARAAELFQRHYHDEQQQLIAFLKTLRAP